MFPSQDLLDLDHRDHHVFRLGKLDRDRSQPVGAVDTVLGRLEGYEDLFVGIEPPAARALLLQGADDFEGNAADTNLLADHGGTVGREHFGNGAAENGDPLPRLAVAVGEHLAVLDFVAVDGQVLGGSAGDVDVDVLVDVFDLETPPHLRHDGGEHLGIALQRFGVERREGHTVGAGDAAVHRLTRVDRQLVGAEGRDLFLHGALRAGPECDHGDHGADADHDAEGRQCRPQLVGPNRGERDLDDLP